MTDSKTNIAFLGICERADYNKTEQKWDILGLKNHLFAYVYPLTLNNLQIGLSIKSIEEVQNFKLRVKEESGKEVFTIDIAMGRAGPMDHTIDAKKSPAVAVQPGWSTMFIRSGIMIQNPGKHFVTIDDEIIGELNFHVTDPAPLTAERIAAIKSDPTSAKAVRIELGCKKCTSKLKVYSAIESNKKLEDEGCVLSHFAPDEFTCECGITKMNTQILKKNLHGLLGSRSKEVGEFSFTKMYEKRSLERIRTEFLQLLSEKDLPEEKIQKFIENNPILLHQFVSEKIIFKPKILTKFIADFGIITPQKELILVGIEPIIPLTKKNGGKTSKLTHAFDQVYSWLHVTDNHRAAFLEGIEVSEKVSKIRGIVIAGRDLGHDAGHLRVLKGIDHGAVSLLTYDDILSSMDTLINNMEKL